MAAVYEYTLPTDDPLTFFKVDSWYKGKDGDKGITAKSSGNPESNTGWMWVTFCVDYIRLISPSNWDEVIDEQEIEELEKKLITELTQ